MSATARVLPGISRSSGRGGNTRSPEYKPKTSGGWIEKSLSRDNRNKGPKRPKAQAAKTGRSLRPAGEQGRFAAMASQAAMLAGVLVILAGVSVGLLAGYRWLTSLNYFALHEIEIAGISRLKSAQVLELTGLEEGVNVLSVNIGKVEGSLSRHPWVAGASVRRILPGKIAIAISERAPTYWMQYEDALYYADEDGKIIDRLEAGARFESLPQLEVEAGMEKHLKLLRELYKAAEQGRLPFALDKVAWIRLSWGAGIEVRLLDSPLAVSLSVENFGVSVNRLNIVWADLARRGELEHSRLISSLSDKVWVEKRGALNTAQP